MRTVQIYVGRDVTDLDCIRVTFTLDGITQTIDVPRIDFLNDRPEYEYNGDFTEGDFIVTEDGDYIVTEDEDFLITETSIYTPSIHIYWQGTQWITVIIINGIEYTYNSLSDAYYPFLSNWNVYLESPELEYLITQECRDLKYERLELFNDEKINVTLSVQNLSDISKTFSDFSQSFTVPGSNQNNKIFEHFYQNDVDSTIDHNLRRPAYIEIDFVPFRQGVISLERANLKNGLVDNYSISFFGQLTSLRDIFRDVKINQLDYSNISFAYNATNVANRITDSVTDYDVRFPLISNNRLWTYADGGANDITTDGGSVEYTELFPAVKIARIFDAIQAYFGVTFLGDFFTDKRFTECFLQAKNATNLTFITEPQNVVFASRSNLVIGNNPYSPADYVSIPDSTITIVELLDVVRQEINFNVTSKSTAGTGYLDIYKNGIYDRTYNFSSTGNIPNFISHLDYVGGDIVYNFKLRSSTAMSIGLTITYSIRTFIDNQQFTNDSLITAASTVLSGNLDVSNYLPDFSVTDFFSGIIRQFNFTCVGVSQNTFEILPLEDWYNQGSTIDVTPYIDSETTDVGKVPLFRNLSFKYQQSEAFTNRQYFAISNSEYGNTNNAFNYDGGDFTIESPFENLLFAESQGTSPANKAILGYFLNSNYQSYIPKPTLLYMYGNTGTLPVNIRFYNGTVNINLTNYTLFGQDVVKDGENYSLNFGADNSIILQETIQNGLFATYYFSYLSNLYNLKQRLTSVKAMLPISILTNLGLNDRLVIRDKRYIINDIKTEITSGEAQLTLYNDFRDIQLSNYKIVDNGANTFSFAVPYRERNNTATVTQSGSAGLTIATPTITWAWDEVETKFTTISIIANTTGVAKNWTLTTTYVNGTTTTYYIIQEA
ncbi:MAG: hypothetical protein ACOVK2_06395 [Candidatus Fonsibacter sp.]